MSNKIPNNKSQITNKFQISNSKFKTFLFGACDFEFVIYLELGASNLGFL